MISHPTEPWQSQSFQRNLQEGVFDYTSLSITPGPSEVVKLIVTLLAKARQPVHLLVRELFALTVQGDVPATSRRYLLPVPVQTLVDAVKAIVLIDPVLSKVKSDSVTTPMSDAKGLLQSLLACRTVETVWAYLREIIKGIDVGKLRTEGGSDEENITTFEELQRCINSGEFSQRTAIGAEDWESDCNFAYEDPPEVVLWSILRAFTYTIIYQGEQSALQFLHLPSLSRQDRETLTQLASLLSTYQPVILHHLCPRRSTPPCTASLQFELTSSIMNQYYQLFRLLVSPHAVAGRACSDQLIHSLAGTVDWAGDWSATHTHSDLPCTVHDLPWTALCHHPVHCPAKKAPSRPLKANPEESARRTSR